MPTFVSSLILRIERGSGIALEQVMYRGIPFRSLVLQVEGAVFMGDEIVASQDGSDKTVGPFSYQ